MSQRRQQQQRQLQQPSKKKLDYGAKFLDLLRDYEKILLICADNVGSNQFQQIRSSLRDDAVILMGKNTVVKKILRQNEKDFPQHQQLLPKLSGNLGFVFTNGDVASIRRKILENKVGAAARVGGIAPSDVILKAGPTGLDPGQTPFFQALDLPTMIARGQIEIKTKVPLIREGQKVTPSQAALLTKLNLHPFEYGLSVKYVFEAGCLFDANVLDLTQDLEEIKALLNDPSALANAMMMMAAAAVVDDNVSSSEESDDGVDVEEEIGFGEEEELEGSGFGAGGLFGEDDDEDWM